MIPRLIRFCFVPALVVWFAFTYLITFATEPQTSIRIFAAASLTVPFEHLMHVRSSPPGESDYGACELHHAGTSKLAFQILEGAAADVFASADHVQMQRIVDAGMTTSEARIFARNKLVIVTAHGNPKQVRALADLARQDLRVALCAPMVPAGRYARLALEKAQVPARSVSDEPSVRSLLVKLRLGEIDAGIVYLTDARIDAEHVTAITIPDEHNVIANYWIATLSTGEAQKRALKFIAHVCSREGQNTLRPFGFEAP